MTLVMGMDQHRAQISAEFVRHDHRGDLACAGRAG
jgi:hypothetical protein